MYRKFFFVERAVKVGMNENSDIRGVWPCDVNVHKGGSVGVEGMHGVCDSDTRVFRGGRGRATGACTRAGRVRDACECDAKYSV
jgi:hypothetical protein